MEVTRLNEDQKAVMVKIDAAMDDIQAQLDENGLEFQKAMETVTAIKNRLRPLREKLSPLGEMKAGLASKKARAKYFPEFTTRNFDDSKNAEYYKFVESKL